MTDPQRDANGEVLPFDDTTISDDEIIVRYAPPGSAVREPDGSLRLSSGLFSASSIPNHGVSFDLLSSLEAAGIDPEASLGEGWGVAYIRVADARSIALQVGRSPILGNDREKSNPHHVEVWKVGSRRLSKGQMNALAARAEVRRWPSPAE